MTSRHGSIAARHGRRGQCLGDARHCRHGRHRDHTQPSAVPTPLHIQGSNYPLRDAGVGKRTPQFFEWPSLVAAGYVIWEQEDSHALVSEALKTNKIEFPPSSASSSSPYVGIGRDLDSGKRTIPGPHIAGGRESSFAAKSLVQVGRIGVPVKYWMFGLRDREIEPWRRFSPRLRMDKETFGMGG